VSTRKVDDLAKTLGAGAEISETEVSRICKGLDEEVSAFRDRFLTDTSYPCVFLDATYCKVRVNHGIVSQAIIVAIGVRSDDLDKHRQVLGIDVGDSEDKAFPAVFLRGLKARCLAAFKSSSSMLTLGLNKR
jgi:putative transposase